MRAKGIIGGIQDVDHPGPRYCDKMEMDFADRRAVDSGTTSGLLVEGAVAIEQSSNARRELRLSDGLLEEFDAFIQAALMNDRISRVTGHV